MRFNKANLKDKTAICNDCITDVQDNSPFYYVVVYQQGRESTSRTFGLCQICNKDKTLLIGHFMKSWGKNETPDVLNHP